MTMCDIIARVQDYSVIHNMINVLKGEFDLVWSFMRVRCSDIFRIGKGCLKCTDN